MSLWSYIAREGSADLILPPETCENHLGAFLNTFELREIMSSSAIRMTDPKNFGKLLHVDGQTILLLDAIILAHLQFRVATFFAYCLPVY